MTPRGQRRLPVMRFPVGPQDLPRPARWAVVGAVTLGVSGGIAGLVIGLVDYGPTAPVAVLEVGLPAAVAGAVAGLVAGVAANAARWIRQRLAGFGSTRRRQPQSR
jgi:membrane associated rhomboid family serine protease